MAIGCKYCKYYSAMDDDYRHSFCLAPQLRKHLETDLKPDGTEYESAGTYAEAVRDIRYLCGDNARWFVPIKPAVHVDLRPRWKRALSSPVQLRRHYTIARQNNDFWTSIDIAVAFTWKGIFS